MKSTAKKALWTTSIFVTVAVIGIPALIIYAPLYRSTTAISLTGNQTFEQLTKRIKSTPTVFPAPSSNDFDVKTSGGKFTVNYPIAQNFKSWEPKSRPIIEIPQGQTETVLGPEKSPFKLVAMRVDYKTGPNPEDRFIGIYDPVTLAPFADKELIKKYRFDEVTGNPYRFGCPRLTFLYHPGASQTHHVFDGRTNFEFKRQGTEAGDGFAMIHHTYQQWHSTPLKVLANREHGEAIETPIQIKDGEVFSGKGFQFSIGLVEQLQHPVRSTGVHLFENSHTFSTKIDVTRDHPILFIFVSFTEMESKPENAKIHIELENGKVVSQRLTFNQQVTPISFGGVDRSQIKRAWVSESPQNSRVLFTIPGVPGMPIENEGLTNFFDAKIPYAKIPKAAFSNFLATAAQVDATDIKWDSSVRNWDSDYFKNVQLNEIIDIPEKDPGIFRLGIENDELVSFATPLEKLKRKFKALR